MRSDLEDELRRALRAEAPEVDTDARDALERRLLAAVPPAAPRGRRWPRWLLATGLGAAVLAGACVLPSEYDADLGHRLAIVIDDAELELDHDAIAEFVLERYHPDEVRMAVERQHSRERGDDGRVVEHSELRLELDAIGDGLDTARIWADLQQAFPELEGARLEDRRLHGRVHGTLGGRLSHDWLDLVIDRHGVAAAKQEILDELAREGITGQPQIEIIDDDDGHGRVRREVRVMVEDDAATVVP
ncbi:MAG: hypothetical protein IPH07_11735 [Deltaproteobacteria bacterium]|nr:hypothetical protein [Deltaproteobacteria bacterium]MBK8237419.1 hypothetical protein [Deltaproteobacteria bacterium]MBP7285541.1 hypothetical protein [Nannocystaceae bacterium]